MSDENPEKPTINAVLEEISVWAVRSWKDIPAEYAEAAKRYEGEGKPFPLFYRTKNGHVFVCLHQTTQEKWDAFVKGLLERDPVAGVMEEVP